ncbi:MAG: hypothetical protein QOF76_2257 [Solirubrobacteraceae bacterium]|jgi:uncharacterized protein YndB with AHSA1/START domain|nr:hypothetical protein [Solirubrobacteraceae bacterium]
MAHCDTVSQQVSFTFTVDRPRDEVYDLIGDLAAHERWCDHFMTDWRIDGDPRAVGAVLHAKATAPGKYKDIELTVVESSADRSVETSTSGKDGRRRMSGVYELKAVGANQTEITFTNEVLAYSNGVERVLGAPLIRAALRKQSGRAMERLKEILSSSVAA